MKNIESQKMTVEIPVDLKIALNERAKASFTTISTVVRQIVNEALSQDKQNTARKE